MGNSATLGSDKQKNSVSDKGLAGVGNELRQQVNVEPVVGPMHPDRDAGKAGLGRSPDVLGNQRLFGGQLDETAIDGFASR